MHTRQPTTEHVALTWGQKLTLEFSNNTQQNLWALHQMALHILEAKVVRASGKTY
jgi:hypothetical protein